MRQKPLKNTSIKLSDIGFGAMSLEGKDSTADIDLIHTAFDAGITYFDTADLYDHGANEVLVGKAVQDFRQDIVLATKVGNQWRADKSGWDWNTSKTYLCQGLEDSLRRLKTDYIDLYQLHGGTESDNFAEIIDTFEGFKQQGKIRAYGISSIRPKVFTHYVQHAQIATNMMPYSLLDRRFESYFESFEQADVAVVVRGALAQGLLAGKPATAYQALDATEVAALQRQQQKQASEQNSTAIQVALQFVLKQPAVASAVIGIRNKKQLKDIILSYPAVFNP